MFILDTNSAVIKYLRNQWNHTAKVNYENTNLDGISAPFIRATIIPTVNEKVETGVGGSSKYDAILAVDIFTELGKGIGESSELEGYIMGIFYAGKIVISDDSKRITFTAPQPLQGLDDGNGYWQATVQCPYYFYH